MASVFPQRVATKVELTGLSGRPDTGISVQYQEQAFEHGHSY